MITRRTQAPAAFVLILIASLLLSATTALGVLAQPGAPVPSTGQVIAHGVDTLPGASATWRLGVVTAPTPGITAMFGSFDTGFAVGWEQPVIATQLPSGESTYLEAGQAVFHPGTSTMRVTSTTGVDEGFISIDLTTDSPDPGASWIGDPFMAPAGTHDVRLTGDSMTAGETGSFVPANDLPYMVYVFAGALQVTDDNGTISELMAEDAMQLDGAASLLAGDATGAHWLIASIGPEVDVPPLPAPSISPTPISTPVASPALPAFGAIEFTMYECPEGADPLLDPSACVPATSFWDMTLSLQGSSDATLAFKLSEGSQTGENVWVAPQLENGVWVIQPDPIGANFSMRFEMTGDILPLGGIWGVPVEGWDVSEVNVYLIGSKPTAETGDLTIMMYECPPGTDPGMDVSGCSLSVDAPDIQLSMSTQAEDVVFHTQSDAYTPEAGTFIFEDLPAGPYSLYLDESGTWSMSEVIMGGDVELGQSAWTVWIPIDGSMRYVDVYHIPAGPPEPTPEETTAIGYLLLRQYDCPPGVADPVNSGECPASTAPWDVEVVNNATGEAWTLSEHGGQFTDGGWVFELPTGSYTVSAITDGTWRIVIGSASGYSDGSTIQVEVTAGADTWVTIYSVAP